MAEKTVFVTVGTTKFDSLIERVTTPKLIKALNLKGYSHLLLQIGNGIHNPPECTPTGVPLRWYRFKDSLAEDIASADLVISHAGAGSCLEVLEIGKPLIIVINEELMGNHQAELARALQLKGYALACTSETLYDTIESYDSTNLKPYPNPDPSIFIDFLNKTMGVVTE